MIEQLERLKSNSIDLLKLSTLYPTKRQSSTRASSKTKQIAPKGAFLLSKCHTHMDFTSPFNPIIPIIQSSPVAVATSLRACRSKLSSLFPNFFLNGKKFDTHFQEFVKYLFWICFFRCEL